MATPTWAPDGSGGYRMTDGSAVLCRTGKKTWVVIVVIGDQTVTKPIRSKKATFDHADALVDEARKEHAR